MAVRNNLLGATDYVDGETIEAVDANDTNDAIIDTSVNATVQAQRNLIRQLQDRSVTFSADGGEWAEAYTVAGGRKGSVVTATSTALFVTNKYKPSFTPTASEDATHDPSSFTNPNNAFDFNSGTESTKGGTFSIGQLGKTFAEKTIGVLVLNASISEDANYSSTIRTVYIYLQTYDGVTWTTVQSWEGSSSSLPSVAINIVYELNAAVAGVRLAFSGSSRNCTARVRIIDYGDSLDSDITHNIPANSFSNNPTIIGTPLYADYEEDSNVKYSLLSTPPLQNITSDVLTGTTVSSVSFTNEDNTFDEDENTYAGFVTPSGGEYSLGKTFPERFVGTIRTKAYYNSATFSTTIVIQARVNGSWVTVSGNIGGTNPTTNTVTLNVVCDGLRLLGSTTTASRTFWFYYLGDILGNESYTLTNDIEINKVKSIEGIIRRVVTTLIPKETDPTPGYPAIHGFSLTEVR